SKFKKEARTYAEKSVLLDIVTEHFNIIECKKTDEVSVKLKNAEWQKIAEKFTATSSTYPRDSHSLKTLWENLKRKAKAALAMQADNNYGTGGRKAKKVVADPIVDMVVGLIRPHVEPFHNIYDDNYEECRSNITTDKKDTNEFEEIIVNDVLYPEDINNDEDDDILLQNNWSQYNPAMMKTQISAALRQPSKASVSIPSTSKMSTYDFMSEDIQPTA
ncbi:fibrinogen silencer-binding protein-like, partial [Aphis craccivora]